MSQKEIISKIENIIQTDTTISVSEKEQILTYLNSIENENSSEIISKVLSLAQIGEILYKIFTGGD